MGSLRFLSTLIDLSHLVKLSLEIDNSFDYYSELTINIEKLLKLTYNIRSLKILISAGYIQNIIDHYMKISSLVNTNIKHLTLSVSTVDEMQMVIHQLKHLSSINFQYRNSYYSSEMHLVWLERENGYYTYRLNNSSISMWFDKRF